MGLWGTCGMEITERPSIAFALMHSGTQSLNHSNHLPPCIEQMTARIARNTFIPPESE